MERVQKLAFLFIATFYRSFCHIHCSCQAPQVNLFIDTSTCDRTWEKCPDFLRPPHIHLGFFRHMCTAIIEISVMSHVHVSGADLR